MPKRINPVAIVITTAMLAILLAVLVTIVIFKADSSQEKLPVLGNITGFELTERSGSGFAKSDMLGKINVVNFFFTSCQGPCPIMAGNMSILYKAFEANDRVQLVSISVDPAVDSLPLLKEYAQRQGVTDNRWLFVRGEQEDIIQISEKQFMLAADALPMMHSIKFVLVDELGQIRGYYTGTDPSSVDSLKADIKILVNKIS
ncbi:MAG: SCO family protein [candidate division Zixibacteria bacterium]|nr:SCO family protein [candidate division Zixibacteria bacterium]